MELFGSMTIGMMAVDAIEIQIKIPPATHEAVEKLKISLERLSQIYLQMSLERDWEKFNRSFDAHLECREKIYLSTIIMTSFSSNDMVIIYKHNR